MFESNASNITSVVVHEERIRPAGHWSGWGQFSVLSWTFGP